MPIITAEIIDAFNFIKTPESADILLLFKVGDEHRCQA